MKRTKIAAGILILGAASIAWAQDHSSSLPAAGMQLTAYPNTGSSASTDVPGLNGSVIADLENGPQATLSAIHSTQTDNILASADKHFHTGRQLYFDGDLNAARREFNAAIEVLLKAPDSLPDRDRIEQHLEDLCDLIYRFDVENLGSGAGNQSAETFDQAPIDELSHMTFPVDPSLAPKVQAELHQTASGIPLDLTDSVLSAIHFFSTERGRRILLDGYERSGKYRDMIERVFAEEGVPEELIHLAQEESGFKPRAMSYRRCVGMWQFGSGTARLYGLEHTSYYDARLDPIASTRAAAKYLKALYARYGDWYLAMAAYDSGPGTVDKAVERTGYADYWKLVELHALPKETANYVPIILAMTIMAKNPGDYGLTDIQMDAPAQYDTIKVTAPTSLNLIADAAMQPVSVIRDLNPALLKTIAPVGAEVHVPKGSGQTTLAALETVPAGNRLAWRLHRVETGETIETVARTYHLMPSRIAAVNSGADSLEAGDVLLIPAVYPAPVTRHRVRRTRGRRHTTTNHLRHISARHQTSSHRNG